jgi:hypothetical protein
MSCQFRQEIDFQLYFHPLPLSFYIWSLITRSCITCNLLCLSCDCSLSFSQSIIQIAGCCCAFLSFHGNQRNEIQCLAKSYGHPMFDMRVLLRDGLTKETLENVDDVAPLLLIHISILIMMLDAFALHNSSDQRIHSNLGILDSHFTNVHIFTCVVLIPDEVEQEHCLRLLMITSTSGCCLCFTCYFET